MLSRVWGSVTNNNGFWIGWLYLLVLLLQLLVTAHNRWLPKTHSIPSWITSVFSSTVTDLHESHLSYELLPVNELHVLLSLDADRKQNTPLHGLSVVICISVGTGMRVHRTVVQQWSILCCHGNPCLPKQLCVTKPLPCNGRPLRLHHSSFQAFWYSYCHWNVLSKALPSNGLFWISHVMSQYLQYLFT
jgi:hypothetical protein